jgi:hypothetical protein
MIVWEYVTMGEKERMRKANIRPANVASRSLNQPEVTSMLP